MIGAALECDLTQQLHVLDVGEGEDFLAFHPAGSTGIVAFGQAVRRMNGTHDVSTAKPTYLRRLIGGRPPVVGLRGYPAVQVIEEAGAQNQMRISELFEEKLWRLNVSEGFNFRRRTRSGNRTT